MLPFPSSGVGYHLMISTLDSETLLYPNGGLLGEIRACGTALAQLQGYIHMLHRHILHTFQMLPAHVPDAFCICFGHVPHLAKGAWQPYESCCSFIARLCACTDASRAHSKRVSHASQTHAAHIADVYKRYLGAELLRSLWYSWQAVLGCVGPKELAYHRNVL